MQLCLWITSSALNFSKISFWKWIQKALFPLSACSEWSLGWAFFFSSVFWFAWIVGVFTLRQDSHFNCSTPQSYREGEQFFSLDLEPNENSINHLIKTACLFSTLFLSRLFTAVWKNLTWNSSPTDSPGRNHTTQTQSWILLLLLSNCMSFVFYIRLYIYFKYLFCKSHGSAVVVKYIFCQTFNIPGNHWHGANLWE